MLQRVAACCSVLQRFAVCSKIYVNPTLNGFWLTSLMRFVLHCVAACCSVLQCVAVYRNVFWCILVFCSVLQCVSVCCSVFQCVAVCFSVLQSVPVRKKLGISKSQ